MSLFLTFHFTGEKTEAQRREVTPIGTQQGQSQSRPLPVPGGALFTEAHSRIPVSNFKKIQLFNFTAVESDVGEGETAECGLAGGNV